MEYGKSAFGISLWVSLVLPLPASGAETTDASASASARITLSVSPRVKWHQTDDPASGRLCLSHIPAHSYYLSIRNIGDGAVTEERLPGQAGNHCVPVPVSHQARMILIVAE